VMRELFAEHGVPMPTLYRSLEDVRREILAGHVVIGRPDTHSRGRGFWKIADEDQFFKAMRGTRKKKAATHFMEYIDAPREYRVHIFKGKSIRISEKLWGQRGETSHGDYITGKPRHNVGHVREAAKLAVKALQLDFGAVDILADDDRCWVLEVNSSPGLGGSMPTVWAETFLKWKRNNNE
jgi:glutathione synthase/RimK-type ligase-like ATP-grasp enzyme